MLGIAGFMGPLLDYLRPTKSPYLVIALAAVIVTCYVLSSAKSPELLYRPDYFLPIYLILIVVIPLSLKAAQINFNRDLVTVIEPPDLLDSAPVVAPVDLVNNAKFENDLDSVFKFSRAFGLAAGVIMMYLYYSHDKPWNTFIIIGYTIIIIHMITFTFYLIFRHFHSEEQTDINLFQIAFITVTLFCGAAFCALNIDVNAIQMEPFYYCVSNRIEFEGQGLGNYASGCESSIIKAAGERIVRITSLYRPDFRQITFFFFTICWLIYEVFWAKTLLNLFIGRRKLELV
jgi:hypothetical protein